MWRIHPQVLQQLTGCFQKNVKHFVQQHQDAIDHHNQQFHLTTVRHNATHKGHDESGTSSGNPSVSSRQHPSHFIHW